MPIKVDDQQYLAANFPDRGPQLNPNTSENMSFKAMIDRDLAKGSMREVEDDPFLLEKTKKLRRPNEPNLMAFISRVGLGLGQLRGWSIARITQHCELMSERSKDEMSEPKMNSIPELDNVPQHRFALVGD
jgi:hypothetical protein